LLHGEEGDMHRIVYSEGGFGFYNEVFPMGSDHVPDDPRQLYYPRAIEEMSDNGNGSPKWIMRRNLTHKLVYRPRGESELYDYTTDPRELSNLWDEPAYKSLRQELLGGMMEWLVQTSDVTPVHIDPRTTPRYPYSASACAVSSNMTSSYYPGPNVGDKFGVNDMSSFDAHNAPTVDQPTMNSLRGSR